MSDGRKDVARSRGKKDVVQAAPGEAINDLLSYAMVELEFGLSILQQEDEISVADREAAQDGLKSARRNILSVADIVRGESRFWASDEAQQEVVLKGESDSKEQVEVSLKGAEGGVEEDENIELLDILLIDDEFRMGRVFQRILNDKAELVMATTVSEAWRLLKVQSFDAIFCDVHLPEVSGVEFFRELQIKKSEQAERVIFITGGLYSEESQKLVDEVDNPVVYKPFSFAAIKDALSKVLEK